jgi:hypothetical protein
MLGVVTPRASTLTSEMTKVVKAKLQRPTGLGLANFRKNCLCGSGLKSTAEAGNIVVGYLLNSSFELDLLEEVSMSAMLCPFEQRYA